MNVPPREDITGIILAGGRGSRMDGADKGLLILDGRTMIEQVALRLSPQVEQVIVSANRNLDRYAAFGWRVVTDLWEDFQGPLAGMASALQFVATPYAVTVPCDSPFIRHDFVERLMQVLVRNDADIAVAYDGKRTHPVFLLLKRSLTENLVAFVDAGERKVNLWLAGHRVAIAEFSDVPEMFININDQKERDEVEARLSDHNAAPV